MEHFIEFLIFGFTVFIAMNQLFDIALLFQSGSYAFTASQFSLTTPIR